MDVLLIAPFALPKFDQRDNQEYCYPMILRRACNIGSSSFFCKGLFQGQDS